MPYFVISYHQLLNIAAVRTSWWEAFSVDTSNDLCQYISTETNTRILC